MTGSKMDNDICCLNKHVYVVKHLWWVLEVKAVNIWNKAFPFILIFPNVCQEDSLGFKQGLKYLIYLFMSLVSFQDILYHYSFAFFGDLSCHSVRF